MGEAVRRARQYEEAKTALLEDLSGDARVVAETSIDFSERFILPSATSVAAISRRFSWTPTYARSAGSR